MQAADSAGMPGLRLDGNDVQAVFEARAGPWPGRGRGRGLPSWNAGPTGGVVMSAHHGIWKSVSIVAANWRSGCRRIPSCA